MQHQDGHSHLLASTIPTLLTYDPAFAYEIAVIIKDGLRRMYAEGEESFYYLTLYNENYAMPAMPEGAEEGILKGFYKVKPATQGQEVQSAYVRQRADSARGAARAGNAGRAIRCHRRCLERDELQVAARRRPARQTLEHAPSHGSAEKILSRIGVAE